ncbi:hypothetical protein HYU92_04120 [Candidatus Curtissbacteria bacterium]|nr:hypothetical protein [Candidatus Curtissbacteria bacterium]
MQSEDLITIIDSLAPINNAFRMEKKAIKKVEYVWELGSLLDEYIKKYKLTLDELLYSIYDPHATIKHSNITRSLGSYSYRIFHFFKKKEDVRKTIPNLKSYNVFIEALPLLVNIKYKTHVNSEDILAMVNSQKSTRQTINRLTLIKQSILPTRKLRIPPGLMYTEEKRFLVSVIKYIRGLYEKNESIFSFNNLQYELHKEKYREQLVLILMALASDSFMNKVKSYKENEVNKNLRRLFQIAISNNEKRSRFRRWVLSANELLWLAEAIHALGDDNDFHFFKKKLEK